MLDVGAGTGALTRELVARGATVVAAEPSPEFTRALRSRFPELEVHEAPAEELPFVARQLRPRPRAARCRLHAGRARGHARARPRRPSRCDLHVGRRGDADVRRDREDGPGDRLRRRRAKRASLPHPAGAPRPVGGRRSDERRGGRAGRDRVLRRLRGLLARARAGRSAPPAPGCTASMPSGAHSRTTSSTGSSAARAGRSSSAAARSPRAPPAGSRRWSSRLLRSGAHGAPPPSCSRCTGA